MKLSGRPLLDTRPDHELFVDRVDEIGRVRAALGQGLNCLLVGERGRGDASLEILRRRMGEAPERLLAEAAAIGGGNPRRRLDVAREFAGDCSKWSGFAAA